MAVMTIWRCYSRAGLFAEWPNVSAPMAEARTDASRAVAQRNLQTLTDCGLICKMTGQWGIGFGRRRPEGGSRDRPPT